MKNLSIKVIDRQRRYMKKTPHVVGEITIGNFSETFDIPIRWWKTKDYEQQWRTGLERLKDHDRSCLVTEVYNPGVAPFISWWRIFKEKNVLYIRNNVLFREYYEEAVGKEAFTPQTCFNFIGEKEPRYIDEDGRRESEWVIPYEDK